MLPGSSTILNGSVLSPLTQNIGQNTEHATRFVRMACCPEAGTVTQEQIDRVCSGQNFLPTLMAVGTASRFWSKDLSLVLILSIQSTPAWSTWSI